MRRHDMAGLASSATPQIGDVPKRMAKADLRKADLDLETWKKQVGQAIRATRGVLSLKEFAAAIGRDSRQVGRWEDGLERPQLDAIFAVPQLRPSLIVALAQLVGEVDVSTTIVVRRRA